MIRIQRNADGSPKTNHATHAADLHCDHCGASASGVDMNANASYIKDISGANVAIGLPCTVLGGCSDITCWPLSNGTADAVELALVKTA